MGRITIFVSESCGYCLRAKKALQERSIPYTEISISTYPERRRDMMDLSDQLTVPQIFFNEEHIGGATELFRLLKLLDNPIINSTRLTISSPEQDFLSECEKSNNNNGSPSNNTRNNKSGGDDGASITSSVNVDSATDSTAALAYFQKHIATKPDPTDERLRIPPPPPVQPPKTTVVTSPSSTSSQSSTTESESSSSCAFGCFILPNGNVESLRVVTSQLLNIMPRQELAYYGKFYQDCFSGKDGVTCLLENYGDGLKSRNDAIEFGIQLQKLGIIHHVCDDHLFQDSEVLFFRLQPYHEPHVLNSFKKSLHCCYNTTKSEVGGLDGLQLVYKLRSIFKRIRERSVTSDGMDYIAASHDAEFELFEDLVSELQCVDITTQLFDDDQLKLVFFINLYNLMIQHAFVKVGIPKVASERNGFFGGVHYNVGGHKLSLDDVEHGIIRANTRHPYQWKLPFANKNDKRRKLSVSKLDPRIHFALNCGANSCPPISTYTVEALDEELRIATMSFFEHDPNLLLNEDKMELSLSMILKWYKNDFLNSSPDNNKNLPEIIVYYLRDGGKRKAILQRMISTGKSIKIKFLPYDWNTDACNSFEFKSSSLSTTRTSFMAFLAQSAVYTVTKRPFEPPTEQPSSSDLQSHPSLTFIKRRRNNKEGEEVQRSRNCSGTPSDNPNNKTRVQRIICHLQDGIETKGIWLTILALLVNTFLLFTQPQHFSNFGDCWNVRANATYPVLLLDLVWIFAAFCYRRRRNTLSISSNLMQAPPPPSSTSPSTAEEYESKKAQ